ncbi:MAG: recombinase family protein [Prochlorothrix sp.]|nr:recombinase family protein [Prochlorothrix sp.]
MSDPIPTPNSSTPTLAYYSYLDPLLDGEQGIGVYTTGADDRLVYQDVAPSLGTKGRSTEDTAEARPQWQQLLQDCKALGITQVQVERWEDLGESLEAVAQRLQDLDDRGITLLTADSTPASASAGPDSQSPEATGWDQTQAQAQAKPLSKAAILRALQDVQRHQRSRNIRKGHARNRIRALPPPGRAPYGYRRGKDRYILDRSTAPIVKEFFDQFILYGSLRGAVRHIAKKYNKRISVSTGQRWLQNPVYRGDLGYKNGEVVTDTHGPIISREEAAQVDRLLRRNRQMAPRTASASRSLAGLVTCGACGSATTVVRTTQRGKEREYLYLRPRACPQVPKCKAVAYEPMLQSIIERICEDLPKAVSRLNSQGLTEAKVGLEGAIAAKERILAQLPELEAQGILDADTAALRRYRVRTELATLRGQLAQLPPVNLQELSQTVAIAQFWLDLSESERRFFFREFIQGIELVRDDAGQWQPQLKFIF